ncbi:DUF4149 domain-containing protein [Helicobacter aurati]|nr:DUF4149 domain-containing protein [Helicobacter aurati]
MNTMQQSAKRQNNQSQKILRIIDSLYLLLLGIGIGGIIACGMFAAPIIFHATDFISEQAASAFSNIDSGQIMGQIFLRLNYYLQVLLVAIIAYELFHVISNHHYARIWLIFGFINVVCIALFVWYYTPFILDKENLRADNFQAMHAQSVWVSKILLINLSVVFIGRAYTLR